MAELLVKSKTTAGGDYGDIIVVRLDGWKWSHNELDKNKFYVFKVPDMLLKDIQYYEDALTQESIVDDDIIINTLSSHKWWINIVNMSQVDKDKLSNNGTITKNKTDILSFIKEKNI